MPLPGSSKYRNIVGPIGSKEGVGLFCRTNSAAMFIDLVAQQCSYVFGPLNPDQK